MTTATTRRPLRGTDVGLLFEAAWLEGRCGPANDALITRLEGIAASFSHDFKVPRDECVGRAWRALAQKYAMGGFAKVSNTNAWLRKTLRQELNNAALAAANLMSEETVKRGGLRALREELALDEGQSVLDRGLDFTDLETGLGPGMVLNVSPTAATPHNAWTDLAELLLNVGWPPGLASETVQAIESYLHSTRPTQNRGAKAEDLSRKLPASVGKGLRIRLARFVIEPEGFLVAVLEGASPEEALRFSKVRAALPELVWKAERS